MLQKKNRLEKLNKKRKELSKQRYQTYLEHVEELNKKKQFLSTYRQNLTDLNK